DNFEDSKAIVYYCGHGIPDEKTGDAYIIPVDGKGTNTATCYSLNQLYTTLSSTKANRVTYFMDACFTGANKEGSMLVAARGVAREAKKETLAGNTVVFSASSGDETAMTYAEKGHGLFTYFLLKKLQATQGNVSYQELAEYINANVKKEAFLINEKPQTPVVATSPAFTNIWKQTMLLK
ncbi:MAG: caspase family protein, partial [Paludibacteraceae bacterium]|nr:caspase family protein [Paludibacteraceae bacterium]